ncbi:MAG: carbohydrate binding domain-containing protein [Verrucomicrobia bacterium]|nr:carbohydrate binding domain-containing protein [Verrucomicrobiota bacterium]
MNGLTSITLAALVLAPMAALHAGETNRVEIDAKETGAVISPLLFGHNLEHTRRAIWQGISAEMVANRKFAATDCGLPVRWTTLGGRGVAIDDKVAYAGRNSVRLNHADQTACGIWQQHEWLAFRKDVKYAFRVWTKANTNQTLRLRVVNRAGFNNVFAGETVVRSGDWQLWSGEFVPPVMAKGARLEISLETPGPVWIGAVSMMPADNFHGMRRDVVDLLKSLKPGNLRWPGGCFAEYYDWRQGLLPVDQRPPIGPHRWVGLLPDSDGYDNHEIGTDEYMALCRELDAAPMITTRFSEGSPAEAGAWVEYCNGTTTTRWGKLRAERGHPEPYGVKYWYVGNELTGMSLLHGEARTNPKVLAPLCRAHVEAMKKADPSIELNVGLPGDATWLEPLFAETGTKLEMAQIGFYFNDWDRTMADVVKAPAQTILPQLKSLRQLLDRLAPAGKRLGIAYYEWNVLWDRSGDVLGGVFAAEMLNLFCREQESLGLALASYFQPVTEGAIKVKPFTSELEPDGQVFALYAPHQGNRLLKTPAMAAAADLDLCASLTPDGKDIYVTVVNRNTTGERTLELSLRNFGVQPEAVAKLLVPITLEAEGKFAQRDEKPTVVDGNKVVLKLLPCAIARIRLGKPGLPAPLAPLQSAADASSASPAKAAGSAANLLPNPSFEEQEGDGVKGWKSRDWAGHEDTRWIVESPGRTGERCLSINSATGADAAWTTTVTVKPNTCYRLSGWIRTKDVRGAAGALLNIQNMQAVRTAAVSGSKDWTRVSTVFQTEAASNLGTGTPRQQVGTCSGESQPWQPAGSDAGCHRHRERVGQELGDRTGEPPPGQRGGLQRQNERLVVRRRLCSPDPGRGFAGRLQ